MSRDVEQDDQFDEALRRHLRSALDPQLGRARLAFQTHRLATTRPTRKTFAHAVRARLWIVGVAGAALAASIAAVWAVPDLLPTKAAPTHVVVNKPAASKTLDAPAVVAAGARQETEPAMQWEPVGSVFNCVSENKGVVLIDDNTPARVVRERSTECVQFICPEQNVRVEIIVPRETTKLIPLETH